MKANFPVPPIRTFDFRHGRTICRDALKITAKGRFKLSVIERADPSGDARLRVKAPEGAGDTEWVQVSARPWQDNLILDQGLDKIATNTWAAVFAYCAAGTGNTPVSDDSGSTTASQTGTTVTLSGSLGAVSAGKLIRWDTGQEAKVVSGSGTSWTVDRSQSVGAGQFTVYRVDQTGLDVEVSGGAGRSATYLTGSPNCDSSRSGSTFTLTRTYDFSSPGSNTNYAEIGVSENAAQSNNLFSRMLIAGGSVTVLTTQQLRVTYQLQLTVSPTTPASKTASISGWPVAPASGTAGTEQMAFIGLSKVATSGAEAAWDGFNNANKTNEPSHSSGQIWISPSSAAHATYPDSPDRRTNASAKALSVGSYTPGNFFLDKSVTFSAGEANRTDYRSMGIAGSNFGTAISDTTFAFLFDEAQTKDNTHTLLLTFRFSWGRDLS